MSNIVRGTADTAVSNSHENHCPPEPNFGCQQMSGGKTPTCCTRGMSPWPPLLAPLQTATHSLKGSQNPQFFSS